MSINLSDLVEHEPVSIALNYINWDNIWHKASERKQMLEDFITAVEVKGVNHKEQDKQIWANLIFQKQDNADFLVPVLLEVTATKGFNDVLVTRKDMHKLNEKRARDFFHHTQCFIKLFEIEQFPSPTANVDRVLLFHQDSKTLRFDDSHGVQKTMAITPKEKREQIEFILSYLGIATFTKDRFNFLGRLRMRMNKFFRF